MFSKKLDKFVVFFVLVTSFCVSQAFPLQDIVSYDEATQIAEICRNRMSGNFPHPNPEKCNLFVRCSFFQSNVETCQENTIYNPDLRICQPGNQLTCEFTSGATTQVPSTSEVPTTTEVPITTEVSTITEVPTTTQTPPTTPSLIERCASITGVAAIPNPDNCGSFVLCIFGQPEIRMCENNEIYLEGSDGCVLGNQMTCEIGTIETTTPDITTTEKSTTTTEESTTTTEESTTTSEERTTTTGESTTTTGESTTTTGESTTTTGESTTTTEIITTNQITTTQELTTSPQITTTVENTTTQPPNNICFGNNFRFIPDPSSCYRYFYCLFNAPIAGECAIDRVFDPKLRGCVLGDRETCTPNSDTINVIVRV